MTRAVFWRIALTGLALFWLVVGAGVASLGGGVWDFSWSVF